MEKTLVIVKPDGVERGLMGQVITRYEQKGLKIVDCKLVSAHREVLEEHYAEHKGKPFYEDLLTYMSRSKVLVMGVEGKGAIQAVRNINGKTNPAEAQPGTIRGDFATTMDENIVHASDSVESAKRELEIWFS